MTSMVLAVWVVHEYRGVSQEATQTSKSGKYKALHSHFEMTKLLLHKCGCCSTAVPASRMFVDQRSVVQNEMGECENKLGSESDMDATECCLKDSQPTWLELWRESKKSAVKTRLINGRMPSSLPRSSGGRLVETVGSCTLAAFAESEARAKDTYTVRLHGPHGLGLSLFISYEGLVTVEGLHYLSDGSASPAQLCDVIRVGDQLVQFNDINLEQLTFYVLTNLLKDIDQYAKVTVAVTEVTCSVLVYR
jgi:hypothetical protein